MTSREKLIQKLDEDCRMFSLDKDVYNLAVEVIHNMPEVSATLVCFNNYTVMMRYCSSEYGCMIRVDDDGVFYKLTKEVYGPEVPPIIITALKGIG